MTSTTQTQPAKSLQEMTPSEVDEALYAIYGEIGRATTLRDYKWDTVKTKVREHLGRGYRDKVLPGEVREAIRQVQALAEDDAIEALVNDENVATRVRGYRLRAVQEAVQAYDAACSQVEDLIASQQPYDEEWERRGRWTRAFLVNNSNGHVHRSMHCTTCFPTTQYHWVTEMSDHSEQEIVEKAGERACTVCYPSAPVEVLARPTQLFTPDEQAKAKAREEREAKRREKDAAKVTVEGYADSSLSRPRTHVFNTVRGATNAIASALGDLAWYGTSHPTSAQWLRNIEAIRAALADKGVEYDYDKALAAARKKVTREGGTAQF